MTFLCYRFTLLKCPILRKALIVGETLTCSIHVVSSRVICISVAKTWDMVDVLFALCHTIYLCYLNVEFSHSVRA